MKKEIVIGLLACVIILQTALPISMIVKREQTLKEGTTFKFKTAPVDPYDPFRGRYVAIKPQINKVKKLEDINLKNRQKVYVQLTLDEDGFAQISQVLTQKPKDSPYLTAKVASILGKDIELDLPIDRYYMEEKAAPRAEKVYQEHSRGGKQDSYVTVKVKDGFAVVNGLYVGNQKIEEAIKKNISG